MSNAEEALVCGVPVKDEDAFRALAINVSFEIEGTGLAESPASYHRPEWEFVDDEAANDALLLQLLPQIVGAFSPWLSHYPDLGFIRADHGGEPTFYLVYRGGDEGTVAAKLGSIPETRIALGALPGAKLVVRSDAQPTCGALLFEQDWARFDLTSDWGGGSTLDRFPAPDESCAAWLARVAVPGPAISRAVDRWERAGGNLDLFGLFGSAGERAAGDRPIEWVIPGLVPRGYVTLLVGTKMAGKSTLLGEMLAVVDSECQTTRAVLGVEITARGVSGIVSGEDGDDFMNRRAEFYRSTHGQPRGLVIDTAVHPWPVALKLLRSTPQLDLIGIDPLRAMLSGDEDSSGSISPFFDDLNALARQKDCGVVLVHHLSKSVPRSLSTMLNAVRGSGAITDRPRVVIGMLDRGHGITEVGIIKQNLPPSEATWGAVNVGRLFRRDAETLTLVPVEAAGVASSVSADEGSIGLVYGAICKENALGQVLRRTGKSELFERRLPQLAGMGRQGVREAVATLIASGRVTDGPDGLQARLSDPAAARA